MDSSVERHPLQFILQAFAVCSYGGGKVGQCRKGAAHRHAPRIAVVFGQLHAALGSVVAYALDAYLVELAGV